MPRPRYNPHPDANQPEIVKNLRELGFTVKNVSRWLSIPDIYVCGYDRRRHERRWTAWELKTEDGDLTEAQQAEMEEHPGDILLARTTEDILREYGQGGQGA